MRLFYRTTPIRIGALILGIYLIALAAHTGNWIYFSIGALIITCREFIFNVEFFYGFIHWYREKIENKKQEDVDTSDSGDIINIGV